MAPHEEVRLETPGGDVVAYLAPSFEVRPVLSNNLIAQSATEGKSVVRDNQVVQWEIVVQGVFEHSENVPDAHKSDLESLFGTSPVTPGMQVNRVERFMLFEGGPFYFYDETDHYVATNQAAVDLEATPAIKPAVSIDEFRPPKESGKPRFEFLFRLKVGVLEQ